MPYVPGVVDSGGSPSGTTSPLQAPQGASAGSPQVDEAYQLMAAAMMHKLGKFPASQTLPGTKTDDHAKVVQMSARASRGRRR